MVEVTENDTKAAKALALTLFNGDYDPKNIKDTFTNAFATHRIEAAKAERGRLRELPEQISVLVSDRAILLLDISETDGRLSRLCDEIRQALADALESQP